MTDLKPCPCGCKAAVTQIRADDWCVSGTRNGCPWAVIAGNEADAIAAWNRRAAPAIEWTSEPPGKGGNYMMRSTRDDGRPWPLDLNAMDGFARMRSGELDIELPTFYQRSTLTVQQLLGLEDA